MVRKMQKDFGVDERTFRKAFNPLLQPFARNDLTTDEFLIQLITPLLPDVDPKQFSFLFNTLPELNFELLNYIKNLKQRYPTYLLSNNFGPVFPNYEKMIHLEDYFTELLLSHKLNISKVDDNMWPGILSKLPFKPDEILFIDNKEQYAAVARKHGVTTIVFLNNKQTMHDIDTLLLTNE